MTNWLADADARFFEQQASTPAPHAAKVSAAEKERPGVPLCSECGRNALNWVHR